MTLWNTRSGSIKYCTSARYIQLFLVSTDVGDYLWVGIPLWYVTSRSGQLSLAIHPCFGTMSAVGGLSNSTITNDFE